MFGGNFAPLGWAFCNGQLMAISENDTLFNLIGTTYGGDGQQTFALPDLQCRLPIHQGPGFVIGQKAGVETVTLTTNQIPGHTHAVQANSGAGSSGSPAGNFWAASGTQIYNTGDVNGQPDVSMNAVAIGSSGGSQPHDNMMPFLCVSFIISLFGVFPSQN